MTDLWARLERWLETNARPVLAGLRPGAGSGDLFQAERGLGGSFSDDADESLRIHDGQEPDAEPLVDGCRLLPLEAMVARLDGVRSHEMWESGWAPFAARGEEELLVLDLAASQVFSWPDRRRAAPQDLRRWLTDLIDHADAGLLVHQEGRGLVVTSSD